MDKKSVSAEKNLDNEKYLAIDIGGTYLKYALVYRGGSIENQGKVKTPKTLDALVDTLSDIINLNIDNILGVAVSAPGRVVSKTGTIYLGGALPFLDGFSVKQFVEDSFNLPCTAINDGKAAAHAELWLGNLINTTNSAVILLGTGVGGGLIVDGKLLQGSHFQAGELSYIFRSPESLSVEEMMGHTGSVVQFINKACQLLELENQDDGIAVFKALEEGRNIELVKLFEDYCNEIVFIINNLQVTLDLEKVVIGGGVSSQPLLLKTIRKRYDEIREENKWLETSFETLDIGLCKFGNEANLLGAVYQLLIELNYDA